MSRADEVGQELRAIFKSVYGSSSGVNNIFAGGNVGSVLLGKSIEAAAETLAKSIAQASVNIAYALEKLANPPQPVPPASAPATKPRKAKP